MPLLASATNSSPSHFGWIHEAIQTGLGAYENYKSRSCTGALVQKMKLDFHDTVSQRVARQQFQYADKTKQRQMLDAIVRRELLLLVDRLRLLLDAEGRGGAGSTAQTQWCLTFPTEQQDGTKQSSRPAHPEPESPKWRSSSQPPQRTRNQRVLNLKTTQCTAVRPSAVHDGSSTKLQDAIIACEVTDRPPRVNQAAESGTLATGNSSRFDPPVTAPSSSARLSELQKAANTCTDGALQPQTQAALPMLAVRRDTRKSQLRTVATQAAAEAEVYRRSLEQLISTSGPTKDAAKQPKSITSLEAGLRSERMSRSQSQEPVTRPKLESAPILTHSGVAATRERINHAIALDKRVNDRSKTASSRHLLQRQSSEGTLQLQDGITVFRQEI